MSSRQHKNAAHARRTKLKSTERESSIRRIREAIETATEAERDSQRGSLSRWQSILSQNGFEPSLREELRILYVGDSATLLQRVCRLPEKVQRRLLKRSDFQLAVRESLRNLTVWGMNRRLTATANQDSNGRKPH